MDIGRFLPNHIKFLVYSLVSLIVILVQFLYLSTGFVVMRRTNFPNNLYIEETEELCMEHLI